LQLLAKKQGRSWYREVPYFLFETAAALSVHLTDSLRSGNPFFCRAFIRLAYDRTGASHR
jgi:hypothetical protein